MKTCDKCFKGIVTPENSCTTGYGISSDGKCYCFECIGNIDFADLLNLPIGGKTCLYLVREKDGAGAWRSKVTNWPGTFSKQVYCKEGRHNIARKRYDVWFSFNQTHYYHGVTYGDFTQICHIKRVKSF